VLVRRRVAEELNGFDETDQGIRDFYEDQAFYAKVCLSVPTVVVDGCWDKYRQRPRTGLADTETNRRKEHLARKSYLIWLNDYLTERGIEHAEIRLAIWKELWLQQSPSWLPDSDQMRNRLRWLRKWILRLGEVMLSERAQSRLWLRK
jgi:hypothetical protein